MDEQDNVILARFPNTSLAFQALSAVRRAGEEGQVRVHQAGVIQRGEDGRITVPERSDNFEGVGMASGSLLGMLVGTLGGPVGILLGWGTGAVLGGVFDVDRESTSETTLASFGRTIPPGSTALIADVHEYANEVMDKEIQKLGGQLTRRPTNEVLSEIEASEDAAQSASDEAERVMKKQRRAAHKEKREERVEALKAKMHKADEAVRNL